MKSACKPHQPYLPTNKTHQLILHISPISEQIFTPEKYLPRQPHIPTWQPNLTLQFTPAEKFRTHIHQYDSQPDPLTWFTNVTSPTNLTNHLDPLIWLTNSTWHIIVTHQPNYYLYHCNIYTNCTKLHHQDGIPTVLIVLTHQSVAQT